MATTVFTNLDRQSSFKKEFEGNLKQTTNLTIATGYFGVSTILDYEKKFNAISENGVCKILVGMLFHGGVTKKQKDALLKIHDILNSKKNESGIYISIVPYHGKIYSFDNESKIYVGSSNFSKEGILSRNECSILVDSEKTKSDISTYLKKLFSKDLAKPLHEVELSVSSKQKTKPTPSTLLKDYIVDKSKVPSLALAKGTINIELRVDAQPNSSLNLYFDKGRKNPTSGLYAPRPWYEIEIGTNTKDRKNPFYPISTLKKSKGKSRNGKFIAYAKDGDTYYKLDMVVSADSGKNIASSVSSGGRATLGKYIKGQLEKAGVLDFGERITSETLNEYGRNHISFTKIDDSTYIIEF